jgi:hypothetical protein
MTANFITDAAQLSSPSAFRAKLPKQVEGTVHIEAGRQTLRIRLKTVHELLELVSGLELLAFSGCATFRWMP